MSEWRVVQIIANNTWQLLPAKYLFTCSSLKCRNSLSLIGLGELAQFSQFAISISTDYKAINEITSNMKTRSSFLLPFDSAQNRVFFALSCTAVFLPCSWCVLAQSAETFGTAAEGSVILSQVEDTLFPNAFNSTTAAQYESFAANRSSNASHPVAAALNTCNIPSSGGDSKIIPYASALYAGPATSCEAGKVPFISSLAFATNPASASMQFVTTGGLSNARTFCISRFT